MKNYRGWLFRFAQANNLGKTKIVDGVVHENCFDFGRRMSDGCLVGFWHCGEYDPESDTHSAEIGVNWLDKKSQVLYAGNERGVALIRSYWPRAEVVCCFKKQQITSTVEQAVALQPAQAIAK